MGIETLLGIKRCWLYAAAVTVFLLATASAHAGSNFGGWEDKSPDYGGQVSISVPCCNQVQAADELTLHRLGENPVSGNGGLFQIGIYRVGVNQTFDSGTCPANTKWTEYREVRIAGDTKYTCTTDGLNPATVSSFCYFQDFLKSPSAGWQWLIQCDQHTWSGVTGNLGFSVGYSFATGELNNGLNNPVMPDCSQTDGNYGGNGSYFWAWYPNQNTVPVYATTATVKP